MADMILGSAQGAVDSLLGQLTSALVDEAQLLGGVRGDVQFIKDEMESMNGFLMHIAEATDDGKEDHQVNAWMKQVAEVAYGSQNCVDRYIQSLGVGTGAGDQSFPGRLCRLPRLLWTLPARHRIAMQIQELKSRALEVGQRRLRYGVEAPAKKSGAREDGAKIPKAPWHGVGDDDAREEEYARRLALAEAEPPDSKSSVIKLLMDEPGVQNVKVVTILGQGGIGKTYTAQMVYNDPVIASSYDFRVWVYVSRDTSLSRMLWSVLHGLDIPAGHLDGKEEGEIVENLRIHIEGKKFLIVLDDVWQGSLVSCIKFRSALSDLNCSPDSAILVTARDKKVSTSLSPCECYNVATSLSEFYSSKAIALVQNISQSTDLEYVLNTIFKKLVQVPYAVEMLLCSLCVNPYRKIEDFQGLDNNLDNTWSNNLKQVLLFIYNDLSGNCKNCLLYFSIYPEHFIFGRTMLVRRWVADGIITKRGRLSAFDEANHCFKVLVEQRLVMPRDIDVTGKVKSCVMHDLIREFVIEIARDQKFVKSNLSPELDHRLSIRNAFQLQQAAQQLRTAYSKSCCITWNHFIPRYNGKIDESNATEVLLESLPLSAQLLEVLDLEYCKELKNPHLKNICNNVYQLKYLSLRNTDITELPKQIDKLRYLETLDIRQTKVQEFAKSSIVLPKLKHLLAGYKINRTSEDTNQSEVPFFTVQMPKSIGTMTELQVLSHVAVFGSGDELADILNLLRLRKLGVVLKSPHGRVLMHLNHAIGKLSRSLRALSIRIIDNENAEKDMDAEETSVIPPKYLHTLKISGLVLPSWVEKLGELTKITLHKTFLTILTGGDIKILGRLTSLRYLRLWQESIRERTLTFCKDGFQNLMFLVIECSDITIVNFGEKSTPELKKIVWNSTGSQTLNGMEKLPSLKEVKLKGNFDLERVEQAVAANTNGPILVTN